MKRAMRIGFAMLLVATILGTARAGEETRKVPLIGVVRIQQIFDKYKYGKEMEASIKKEFETDRKEIEDLEKQISEKMENLRHDPLVRPGSTKFKLEMLEIKRLEISREDKMNKFKKETAARMAEFYRNVYAHFRKSVEIYAKYHKYDLIITAPNENLSEEGEGSNSPQAIQNEILLRRVQYISGSTDVTDPIIQLMNQRYDKWKESGGKSGPLG